MDIENPKFIEEILLEKLRTVEAGLLRAYPDEQIKGQLQTGSRHSSNQKVEACLSYRPQGEECKECIDLTFGVACSPKGAVFSSEIAWSDGKVIDEVVVCEVCPECFDDLGDRIDNIMARIQEPLIERMVELLENFC